MRKDIAQVAVLHGAAAASYLIGFKKNKPLLYVAGLALMATGIVVSRKGRKAAGTI